MTGWQGASAGPRVWIFNHYAAPPDQGAGTRHFSLAREATRYGADVTIFAAGFGHATGREHRVHGLRLVASRSFEGVRFVWLRTLPYRGNGPRRMLNMLSYALVAVVAQATRARPDVVIGSTVHPFAALAAWFVARSRGARFIYEVRDLWPQTLVDLGELAPASPGARLLWWIEAFLVRRAEVVITLLPGMTEYLESRGLPTAHVRYLPNGVDVTAADPTSGPEPGLLAEMRGRRAAGEVVFVYLGAHGRVNRLDVVVRAAASAAARSPVPIHGYLIGEGPAKPALRDLAKSLGTAAVTFADPIPKTRVPEILGCADAGIVHATWTPVYRYGISFNKLWDYMGASLPVVFACSTAMDPVAASGGGLTTPPDDPEALAEALVAVATMSPEGRRAMGRAARGFVERAHDLRKLGAEFAHLIGCRVGPA